MTRACTSPTSETTSIARPRIDQKLARGLALAEIRALARNTHPLDRTGLNDPDHPVRRVLKPLYWRYKTGRRPDDAFVRRALAEIDALYEGRPGTVRAVRNDADGVHECAYVHVSAMDDSDYPILRLKRVRLSVLPNFVGIDERWFCEISGHAVERFHQRTREGLRRDALRHLIDTVIARLGIVDLVEGSEEILSGESALTRGRVPIPFADGLALGELVACPADRPAHFVLDQFLPDAETTRSQSFYRHTYRLSTFIGPREMKPNQVALRDEMLAFEKRHAWCLRHAAGLFLTPHGFFDAELPDISTQNADAYWASTEYRYSAAITDLDRICAIPDFVRAMGNTP